MSFIVFDGMDGSGKDVMTKLLHNYLFSKDKRFNILTTREPTFGKYGKRLRKLLKDDKPEEKAKLCLRLFVKDRKEHLRNVILPFLKLPYSVVICDRYYYSTLAYQHAQGIALEKIIRANKKFIKPDIAFILDVPAEIALKRIKSRKGFEKFEKLEFMKKLRENFLMLPSILEDNIKVIDASKPIKKVFKQIRQVVSKLILQEI